MKLRTRSIPAYALLALLATSACQDGDESQPLSPETPPEAPDVIPMQAGAVEGYPGTGEVATGWIFGRDGRPKQITYAIHDGLAIWEGDIVVGRAETMATTRSELVAADGVYRAVYIDGNSFRWPDGVVPFEVAGDLSATAQTQITNAIGWVEDRTPGVTLVPHDGEADFVRFVVGDGCSSAVGRQGGQQNINLLVGGCSTGSTAHEILHALGLFHEHTRCDRDTRVTINEDEIEDGKEHNFDKNCADASDHGDYDEGSVMHYGPFAFAIGSTPTIVSNFGLDGLMGQRDSLGPTDIATVEFLYGANNQAPEAVIDPLEPSYDEGSAVPFTGSNSSDPDDDDNILTFAWLFGDGTCTGGTPPSACSTADPSHTYVDDGDYDVELTVSDGFADDMATATATILNVAPTVNAGPDAAVTSGETYAFSGSFSDPGVEDAPWSWVITWNDGQAPPTDDGTTDDQSALIEASRLVCAAGEYMVELSVTDKDGGEGSDQLTLTVPYFEVDILIQPNSNPETPVNLKRGGNLPVAILSTADFDATDVDPSTAMLGDEAGGDTPVAQKNNGAYEAYTEDVNGDGLTDLVLMFEVPALVAGGDLVATSTELVLRAFMADACTNVRGAGAVAVRP